MKRIIIASLMVCSSSLLHTMVTQSTVVQYDKALKDWKRTGSQADAQTALDLYNRIAGTRWEPTTQNINRREGITVTDLQTAVLPRRAPIAPPAAPVIAPAAPVIPAPPAGGPAGGYIPARPIVGGPGEGDLAGELARREERERRRQEQIRAGELLEQEEAGRLGGVEYEEIQADIDRAEELRREREEAERLGEISYEAEAPGLSREERLAARDARLEAERLERLRLFGERMAKEKAERDKKIIVSDSGFVFEPDLERIIISPEAPEAPPMGKRVYEQRIQDDIKEVYAKINEADAELRKIPLEKAEIAQAYNKQTDAENLRDRIQNQLDPDDLAALNVQIRKLQRRIEMAKTKIDVQQDKIGAIKSIEDDIKQGIYQITPRYGMSANIKKAMSYYLKAQQSLVTLRDTLEALGDPLDASLFKQLNNDLIELKASIYAEQAKRPASLEAIIEQYPELQSELHKIEKELSAIIADIGWPNPKNKKWLNDPKKRQTIVSHILNMQLMLNNIVEMHMLSTEDQQIIQQKIDTFAQAIAADLFNAIQPLSENLQQGMASDKGRQNFIQLFENISTLMRSGVRLDNYQNKFDNIQKQYDILNQGIPSAPPLTEAEAARLRPSKNISEKRLQELFAKIGPLNTKLANNNASKKDEKEFIKTYDEMQAIINAGIIPSPLHLGFFQDALTKRYAQLHGIVPITENINIPEVPAISIAEQLTNPPSVVVARNQELDADFRRINEDIDRYMEVDEDVPANIVEEAKQLLEQLPGPKANQLRGKLGL